MTLDKWMEHLIFLWRHTWVHMHDTYTPHFSTKPFLDLPCTQIGSWQNFAAWFWICWHVSGFISQCTIGGCCNPNQWWSSCDFEHGSGEWRLLMMIYLKWTILLFFTLGLQMLSLGKIRLLRNVWLGECRKWWCQGGARVFISVGLKESMVSAGLSGPPVQTEWVGRLEDLSMWTKASGEYNGKVNGSSIKIYWGFGMAVIFFSFSLFSFILVF